MILIYQTFTRHMTIKIDRAGISGTDIKPDTPEWYDWFNSAPEGTKIQFEYTTDSLKTERFTAYRRKRYWEAQKRVSRKLRNTTIKPSEVTYENLKQVLLKLTAYNWADKFEIEKSGTQLDYQTSQDEGLGAGEVEALKKQIEELKSENDTLKGRISYLLDERGLAQAKANDDARIELERLQKLNDQLEKENIQLNRVYSQSEDISRKYHQRANELQAQLNECQAIAKTIDRSELTLNKEGGFYQLRGKSVIYLEDLEKLGFKLT